MFENVSYDEFIERIDEQLNKNADSRDKPEGFLTNDKAYRQAVGDAAIAYKKKPFTKSLFTGEPHEQWGNWFSLLATQYGEERFQDLKKTDQDNVRKLAGGTSAAALAYAIHYRLHADFDHPEYANQIDRLIWGQSFDDEFIGPVFKRYVLATPPLHVPAPSRNILQFTNKEIDLFGRELEQKLLSQFLNARSSFCWMQLAGAAGQGKSALALWLVETAKSLDWDAGFLSGLGLEQFQNSWSDWEPSKPTLLVVDHALGVEKMIGRLLAANIGNSEIYRYPVRLLLVERQPFKSEPVSKTSSGTLSDITIDRVFDSDYSDWFSLAANLRNDNKQLLLKYLHDIEIIILNGLKKESLIQIVKQIIELNNPSILIEDDKIYKYIKRVDQAGRPLYAKLVARKPLDKDFSSDWSERNVLDSILDRERQKAWSHYFDGFPPELSDDHVAIKLAILANMIGLVDCTKLVKKHGWQPIQSIDRKRALAINDQPLEVSSNSLVGAREPGILGEWIVLRAFSGGLPIDGIVKTAWSLNPRKMAAFLIRSTMDFLSAEPLQGILEVVPSERA